MHVFSHFSDRFVRHIRSPLFCKKKDAGKAFKHHLPPFSPVLLPIKTTSDDDYDGDMPFCLSKISAFLHCSFCICHAIKWYKSPRHIV